MSDKKGKNFDGVQSVAEMLKVMDTAQREKLIGNVKQHDPELAESLQHKLFSFEDLVNLPAATLQILLRKAPQEKLALALRGVPDSLVNSFLKNMSARAAKNLQDALEVQGQQRRSAVVAAQQEIVALAAEMKDD